MAVEIQGWCLWNQERLVWNLRWPSRAQGGSRELLLLGLFGAERALGGGRAALTLQSVATGQGHRALLATRHTALSLFPVHHLEKEKKGQKDIDFLNGRTWTI